MSTDDVCNALQMHLAAAANELRQFDETLSKALANPFIAAVDARVIEARSRAYDAADATRSAQSHLAAFAGSVAEPHIVVEEQRT